MVDLYQTLALADRLARALIPLLEATDPEMRRLAMQAALLGILDWITGTE